MLRNANLALCNNNKKQSFEKDKLFVKAVNTGLSSHASIKRHNVFISTDDPKLARNISALLNKLISVNVKLISACQNTDLSILSYISGNRKNTRKIL